MDRPDLDMGAANNKLTDAELNDLREFTATVLNLCAQDEDLAVEIEMLALTAAEILGLLEGDEDEDEV